MGWPALTAGLCSGAFETLDAVRAPRMVMDARVLVTATTTTDSQSVNTATPVTPVPRKWERPARSARLGHAGTCRIFQGMRRVSSLAFQPHP